MLHKPMESSNAPARFQFRLRSLFIVTTLLAIILGGVRGWQDSQRPVQWQPFSQDALDSHLNKGHPVVVAYYSHWKPRPLWSIADAPGMRHVVRRDRILVLDANQWCVEKGRGSQIRDSLRSLGRDPSERVVVIYRPNAVPVILPDRNVADDIGDRVLRELVSPKE